MITYPWFRAILSGIIGLLTGVTFTALVNLISPIEQLTRAIILA